MISQSELKLLFSYNPDTGLFVRLSTASNRVKIGAISGSINQQGYLDIRINGRLYKAHRLAWLYMHGEFPLNKIDHINRVRNDNRLCNLRLATDVENCMNRKKSSINTSGYKGVSRIKLSGKWCAQARINGKVKNLGHFKTAEEASVVYNSFAIKNHGAFYCYD